MMLSLTKREVLEGVVMSVLCTAASALAQWGVDALRDKVCGNRDHVVSKEQK